MGFLMKEDYFVFGKYVFWNGMIVFLEVNRDSFVIEWDGILEKEIEQLEGYCLLIFMIFILFMLFIVIFSFGLLVYFVKKVVSIGMLFLKEILYLESRILL